MIKFKAHFAIVIAFVSLVGCTHYGAISSPPPGKTASVDSQNDRATISRGVALAIECSGCKVGESFSDDSTIASVLPASVDALSEGATSGSRISDPTFVLVGENVGATRVRIAVLNQPDIDLQVTVLDD